MPLSNHIRLLKGASLLALVIATIAIIAESLFVLAMKLTGHHAVFTSFFSVVLFSVLAGFIPLLPSPSRISSAPVGFIGRMLLVIEVTAFVVTAIFASSTFMAYRNVVVPVEKWFPAYAYALILIAILFVNFTRLRREISTSR